MTILCTKQLGIVIGNRCFTRDLSITFLPGQVWGLLGPNGSGKTTLLHTLAGLRNPNYGTVSLDEKDLKQLSSRKRAQNIGLLLQDFELPFTSTVLETALTGRYPHQYFLFKDTQTDIQAVEKALNNVGIAHLSKRDVQTLSGGEKQRLMLATVLAQDPNIYLLDEPLNHLDLQQRMRLLSLFKNIAVGQHKIVVMVLHDVHWIEIFCDHLIILGHQKNIFGSVREVLNTNFLNQLFVSDPIQELYKS
jgi:iron complex transport system ATP-binding protein